MKHTSMHNCKCMNCKSTSLESFIDLGDQPNGNIFPSKGQLETEEIFPFEMLVCLECWQVQIKEFPSVESMFLDHPYISGINKPVVKHFAQLAKDVIQKIDLAPNSLVLDIGANDGTLLSKFRDNGMRVIGIDPCNQTNQFAKQNSISVCKTFWNKESAEALNKLALEVDLITATAVFYHVEDIHSFVEGLAAVMHDKTVFCTQCVYLKDVIEQLQFDHFYHEHTMIHAIKPLKRLFEEHGLRLIDVEHYDIHGGSFVLYVARDESEYITSPSIAEAIKQEEEAGLFELSTYIDFTDRVNKNKLEINNLLRHLKEEGKTVYGLGAPLKSSTLLNYYEIGPDLIDCCTEINPLKIDKYTPGTHIPIVDEKTLTETPDYYLILSWNFLDFFLDKYSDYLAAGGQFIVPNPEVHMISGDNKQVKLEDLKEIKAAS